MPRNVRNWWISATMDGRETPLEGGPVSKTGGISVTLKQRDSSGDVHDVVHLNGFAYADGTLMLRVENLVTKEQWEIESHR